MVIFDWTVEMMYLYVLFLDLYSTIKYRVFLYRVKYQISES
jgi:hypothetical protein